MRKSLSRRQKIVYRFFLSIGCPSLILGYLAFRGIQNDQALLEKERRIEHHQLVQRITESVEDSIKDIESIFLPLIIHTPMPPTPSFIDSIRRIILQVPLIETVFYFTEENGIMFPETNLLYHTRESLYNPDSSFQTSQTHAKIKRGQQFEFEQEKFDEALKQYRQVFSGSTNKRLKGDILNHIARVQKKSGNYWDAIQTYQKIVREYKSHLSLSGLPLSLAAGLELGSLHIASGDTIEALESYLDSYQELVNGNWILNRSQYFFFSQRIQEQMDQILAYLTGNYRFVDQNMRYLELKRKGDELQRVTERLTFFQDHFFEYLKSRIPENSHDSLSVWKRFDLEKDIQKYFVSIYAQQVINSYRGLLLDQNHMREKLIPQAIHNTIPSEQTGWIIRGMDGQILLTSGHDDFGPLTVQVNFIDNFPPWILELYQSDTSLFKTFLFSRRSIYFYMFLFIGGILIFGLILSIRSVTHELELARMKSDFVSTISHEFKSPLTSIRQISEMLQNDRLPSKKRRHEYYDVLVNQSERLSLLIDNILDISKLEEGKRKFHFEPVDIEILLKDVVATIHHRTHHEGFSIQMKIEEHLPTIKIDKSAIIQAITNILDNAVKFSGKKKEVILRAFKEVPYITISVQDFGVGMKAEDMDKIFERFYRGGDELTRIVKGSGLGLTIVKQIIEAHHGTIQVKSVLNKGSTFKIKLPINNPIQH